MLPHRLTEFTIYLAQRPGELAGVLEAAAVAGVDIHAVAAGEHNDRGMVHLIGTPEEALRHVMESLVESGIGPVVESPVLAVAVDNRPGAVRDISVLMADARVNIRRAYMASGIAGQPSLCVFRFDDPERAAEVIESIDWPVQKRA